jgi:hypothetical protein
MASNDKKDDPSKGGGARPQATLDLRAKTVGVSAPEAARQGAPKTVRPGADGAPAAPSAPAPRKSSGAGAALTHLVAGLFGGFVSVFVTYFAVDNFRDNLPILTDTGASTLRTRLVGLEKRLNILEFDTNRPPAPTVSVSASAGESKPAPAAVDPQLQQKLSAANALAEESASQVKSLEQRLVGLESRLSYAESSAASASSSHAMTSPPSAPVVTQAPTIDVDGKLRAEIDPLRSRVDALDKALQGVSKWRTEQQNTLRVTAVSSALNTLRRAFDQGKPYEAELRAVVASSPIQLDFSTLEDRQKQGVESQARLLERFAKASKEAISRAKGGGFVGEAISRMQSAVRVKPAGSEEAEGQEPEAVITRMETRLKAGDLPGALREGRSLKEPAAGFFTAWMTDAETKAAGLEALGRAEAKLAGAVIDAERSARRGG